MMSHLCLCSSYSYYYYHYYIFLISISLVIGSYLPEGSVGSVPIELEPATPAPVLECDPAAAASMLPGGEGNLAWSQASCSKVNGGESPAAPGESAVSSVAITNCKRLVSLRFSH